MRKKSDKIKQLEKEKKALELDLARSQLEVLAMKSMIEVAESHYGVKIKKTMDQKPPKADPGKSDSQEN